MPIVTIISRVKKILPNLNKLRLSQEYSSKGKNEIKISIFSNKYKITHRKIEFWLEISNYQRL